MTTENQAASKIPANQTAPEKSADQTAPEKSANQAACETAATPLDPKIPDQKSGLVNLRPRCPDGLRIQRKREACRLTRYGLERRCRISASTIKLLEYGREVKPRTLLQIETCLDALMAERGVVIAEEPESSPDTLR